MCVCVYYFQVALFCERGITKALLFFTVTIQMHLCFSIDLLAKNFNLSFQNKQRHGDDFTQLKDIEWVWTE